MSIHQDGCFPDAPTILTEEEYFDKVTFDYALVQNIGGVFHWPINSKQGYIQKGEFRKNLEWALVYEWTNNDNAIAFNFGDLLIYVPVEERLKWKQFYQDTDIKIHKQDKLLMLFYDKNNYHDTDQVSRYWNSRIENSEETDDLPWWTKREKERLTKELHYLKANQYDREADRYRDIRGMYFKHIVLDVYRNNELCEIGQDHISFLRQKDKKTPASTVRFDNRNFANIDGIVLMVQAQDYISVPPRQRPHWQKYEILESQIKF